MNEPRDILQALFVGDDVDSAEIVQAARAASADDELRELFNTLALADREVGGDFEAEVGEAWFVASLDEMLATEDAAEPDNVVSLASRRSPVAPVLFAAAAAIALTFVAVALQQRDAPAPEFQARSAAKLAPTTYDAPSLEVFCVKRTDEGVRFEGSEQAELATVRCSTADEIKLAVRNPDARLRYAAFFGISADHSLHWYGPSPAATAAVPMPTTTELTPIGETIRLDVNHEPSTVRVIGVFTEEPLGFAEIEKWTARNAASLREGVVDVSRGTMVRQTFEVTQ